MAKFFNKTSLYLPRLSLAALIICLVSGVVLAFQYRPFGNVFQNVEEITTLVPYGFFFRRLHYASGEVFAILVLLHVADYFFRSAYKRQSFFDWFQLGLGAALCFFILFTGFILQGGLEGYFAGTILRNLLELIPFVGSAASHMVIGRGHAFYFLPYLYHCCFLPLGLVFLLRKHIRDWLPDWGSMTVATMMLFIYALAVPMPKALPPGAETSFITGPWFFLGVQELLRHFSPLWAGLFLPALFAALFLSLPALSGVWARVARYTLLTGAGVYAVLSVKLYFF